jgi:hypothetical protein
VAAEMAIARIPDCEQKFFHGSLSIVEALTEPTGATTG